MAIDETQYHLKEMDLFGGFGSGVAYLAHDNGHKMQVDFDIDKTDTINGMNVTLSY